MPKAIMNRPDLEERLLIQKFLGRTILYNRHMMAAVRRLGLTSIEVTEQDAPAQVADLCLAKLGL